MTSETPHECLAKLNECFYHKRMLGMSGLSFFEQKHANNLFWYIWDWNVTMQCFLEGEQIFSHSVIYTSICGGLIKAAKQLTLQKNNVKTRTKWWDMKKQSFGINIVKKYIHILALHTITFSVIVSVNLLPKVKCVNDM